MSGDFQARILLPFITFSVELTNEICALLRREPEQVSVYLKSMQAITGHDLNSRMVLYVVRTQGGISPWAEVRVEVDDRSGGSEG